MSIDRLIPTSGAGVTGSDFAGAIQEEVTGLWGNSVIPLTGVAGTGDAITATVSPALTDGLAVGMNFWLIAAADNTGPATIAIGDEDPVDLADDDGTALGAALLKNGRRYLLAFDGTVMRVLGTSGQKRIADYQEFTADGTWNKPAGTPVGALIVVELWGGGGGGGSSGYVGEGGGGGGEYKHIFLRAGDVSASVSVTVAAAVATQVAGNNSSFGTYVTAYGGGRGENGTGNRGGGGGGGGGAFGKGGNGGASAGGTAGGPTAGAGGTAGIDTTGGGDGGDGYFGGAGGGGGCDLQTQTGPGGDGGRAVYGGGGGAASADGTNGSAGTSTFGGDGGAVGANGSAPGGGGGGNGGGGARGEVRVRTVG